MTFAHDVASGFCTSHGPARHGHHTRVQFLHAGTVPACRNRAGDVRARNARPGEVQNSNVMDQSRRPSPRVMKSLDPCRAAMVRRYAAELPDHNGSSDRCALLELDALCTALRSMCAVGRLTPLTSSHPTTSRVHIGEARRPLPPSTGMMPVQWRSL